MKPCRHLAGRAIIEIMSQNINYNYLDLLNPQQREAVVYKNGPALVIAGAGSGKTRVLTYKIVDLLHNGFQAYRILALTFTNKAAREMKQRVAELVGDKVAAKLWMGTFHSIFLRILRQHADALGYKRDFTIYDSADSRSLIKMIIKQLELDDKIYKPATVQSIISNAKNAMVTADIYAADPDYYEADRRAKRPMIKEIFQIYENRCKSANVMDFDDILVNMNLLLSQNPDICRHYQEFFSYILVDEYQDTNYAQHLVISQLSKENGKICVVGDDAQSIYSFRGANIANILSLDKKYKNLKIFKLERNYRSTQNIINAAGSLIDKNAHQLKKNVYSEKEKGEAVGIVKAYSDLEEAFLLANMISQAKLTYHDSYEDYAILYRTNAQSRVIEESLRKRDIPYRIYGGLSFYQRKEVKDIIAYFRLSVNPDDDEALRRVINYPSRGIGETTMKKLQNIAQKESTSLWGALGGLGESHPDFNKGTIAKLVRFRTLIEEFADKNSKGMDAFELGQLITNQSGILLEFANDTTPESVSRKEHLSEILSGLKQMVNTKRMQNDEENADMSHFLSEVMLATDQDNDDSGDGAKVTLMTAHAAKGLEFKHVYVSGVEEDLFPSAMSKDSTEHVEEERRLLYVAITRAEETCILTYAGSRMRNGQTVLTSPSRFLSEMNPKFLKLQTTGTIAGINNTETFSNPTTNYFASSPKKTSFSNPYLSRPKNYVKPSQAAKNAVAGPGSHSLEEVRIGTRISHKLFGEGVIEDIKDTAPSAILIVDFSSNGVKKLFLDFAKFDILKY